MVGGASSGVIRPGSDPGPPDRRAFAAQGITGHDLGYPGPGDAQLVQDGEGGAVVLEALAPGGAPDRDQVLLAAHPAAARRQQPAEPHITSRARLVEQQERRHLRPGRGVLVSPLEGPAQQQVALSWVCRAAPGRGNGCPRSR